MLNVMPLNAARAPRSIVKLNGSAIGAVVSWQLDNNSNYQADTFRVDLAAGVLPAAQNVAWLSSQADLSVEILAGFPANPQAPLVGELTSFILGRVDDIAYDAKQNTVTLSGRDYTSQLIDTKTTEVFANQTAAQIVATLAARHGLTANAVSNPALVGSYYEIDHRRLTDEHTEWDLLTWLAHQENCNVWVSGTTLNFQPVPDPTADTYVITWTPTVPPQANVIDLKFARNLTLAKDVTVIVNSWNSKQKKGFKVTAKATHSKNKTLRNPSIPYGEPQVFTQTIPGLTVQEAQVRANALLASISAHEVRLDASLPGDNILTTRTLVTVQGTGTAFDQVYYPDSVVRSMSVSAGYRMELAAKNHSPESTVNL